MNSVDGCGGGAFSISSLSRFPDFCKKEDAKFDKEFEASEVEGIGATLSFGRTCSFSTSL